MLIYTPNISIRLKYVIDFVSGELFTDPIAITNDKDLFHQSGDIKINYSTEKFPGIINISPHSLLFEQGIVPQNISVTELNGRKIFFQIPASDFPFDIFAAIFYLLSRY